MRLEYQKLLRIVHINLSYPTIYRRARYITYTKPDKYKINKNSVIIKLSGISEAKYTLDAVIIQAIDPFYLAYCIRMNRAS